MFADILETETLPVQFSSQIECQINLNLPYIHVVHTLYYYMYCMLHIRTNYKTFFKYEMRTITQYRRKPKS